MKTDKLNKPVKVTNKWKDVKERNFLNITYGELEKYRLEHPVCEICGMEERALVRNQWGVQDYPMKLSVDHDHETNKFRGLLCRRCNRAMGWYDKYKENIKNYEGKGLVI